MNILGNTKLKSLLLLSGFWLDSSRSEGNMGLNWITYGIGHGAQNMGIFSHRGMGMAGISRQKRGVVRYPAPKEVVYDRNSLRDGWQICRAERWK